MAYVIHWTDGTDCGELPGTYDREATAERAARAWKRDLIATSDHPWMAQHKCRWEVVEIDLYTRAASRAKRQDGTLSASRFIAECDREDRELDRS